MIDVALWIYLIGVGAALVIGLIWWSSAPLRGIFSMVLILAALWPLALIVMAIGWLQGHRGGGG